MTRMERNSRRPNLESLESRELLTRGQVPSSFLFTPIPETAQLAEHIHPFLTIVVDGQQQTIPAGIGLGPNGNLPIHTHDNSGIIHVESTAVQPFRLRDFFTIWGQRFDQKHLLNLTADRKHRITMTVDGRPSNAFGNLPLQNLQDIVIRYVTVRRR
ncbi:MAG: hypothetical protein JWN86_2339 [Planctomycetota bacterium]|nr:hypothetical protein [Planctomycetota bacterium]